MPVVPTFTPSAQDWSHTHPEISPYSPFTGAALSVGKLAREIAKPDSKDMLLLLSKKNDLQQQRIQEILELQDTRTERNALNLTQEEKDRINEEYETFMDGIPSNLETDAARIFYSINAQHLGRVATHELREMQNWRDTESMRTVVTAEQKAQQLSIGDFPSLFKVTGEMRGLLKSDILKNPKKAEASSRMLINDTYAVWARTDPDAAEEALTRYSTQLQEIMGGDYNKLLVSLQTGRAIAEQRRESDYRWMIRSRDELYENTTKAGVTKFLNPKDRLTVDWIVANEKRMNNTQMRILYALLQAQDTTHPMSLDEVDYPEYWRLSRLVRHRLDHGHEYETVGLEIANAAEVSITGTMAKNLMDRLNAEREMSPEQKRAYRVIEEMEFSGDKNRNAAIKSHNVQMLDLWIERHPNTDPMPFLEENILKDQKDDIVDYWLDTYANPARQPGSPVWELEHSEFPYATTEEQMEIQNFYLTHPEVSDDPYTYTRILNRMRELQQRRDKER